MLALFEGDFAAASLSLEEALSIGREVENKMLIAYAGQLLGMVRLDQGNTMAARSLSEESYSLVKNLGDIWSEALTLYHMGIVLYRSVDLATARTHVEGSQQLIQQVSNREMLGLFLINAGEVWL